MEASIATGVSPMLFIRVYYLLMRYAPALSLPVNKLACAVGVIMVFDRIDRTRC